MLKKRCIKFIWNPFKIFKYNTHHIFIDYVFTANVIIDLCHERDNYYQYPLQFYSHAELKNFLKSTCTL